MDTKINYTLDGLANEKNDLNVNVHFKARKHFNAKQETATTTAESRTHREQRVKVPLCPGLLRQ